MGLFTKKKGVPDPAYREPEELMADDPALIKAREIIKNMNALQEDNKELIRKNSELRTENGRLKQMFSLEKQKVEGLKKKVETLSFSAEDFKELQNQNENYRSVLLDVETQLTFFFESFDGETREELLRVWEELEPPTPEEEQEFSQQTKEPDLF